MKVTGVLGSDEKRRYPLGQTVRAAWKELGVKPVRMAGGGATLGLDEYWESWVDGRRQAAHHAYPLDAVKVNISSPIVKLQWRWKSGNDKASTPPTASGVVLRDGRVAVARKKVVLAAGTLQTPLILQASGIGPKPTFARLRIPVHVYLPAGKRRIL